MRTRYYRVCRLVVLPDYQGIGVGKRLLNFVAELYTSQTRMPFYILTSNPQIIRGNMENWKVTRFGHACKGKENTKMNNEIRASLSRKRITVSMQYIPGKTVCWPAFVRIKLVTPGPIGRNLYSGNDYLLGGLTPKSLLNRHQAIQKACTIQGFVSKFF